MKLAKKLREKADLTLAQQLREKAEKVQKAKVDPTDKIAERIFNKAVTKANEVAVKGKYSCGIYIYRNLVRRDDIKIEGVKKAIERLKKEGLKAEMIFDDTTVREAETGYDYYDRPCCSLFLEISWVA